MSGESPETTDLHVRFSGQEIGLIAKLSHIVVFIEQSVPLQFFHVNKLANRSRAKSNQILAS